MCPNCGGEISSLRLAKGLLCQQCQPDEGDPCSVADRAYEKVCELEERIQKFRTFFKEKVGFDLRNLQEMWAMRFFLGRSFALLAPTGVGKSTFGLVLASFLQEKSYLIFPTHLLAKEAFKRLQSFGADALFYDSHASQKSKEETKRRIQEGNFHILITTTSFLYRNFLIIPKDFGFVFVDDVDSVLKSAKNIDKILMLLGFDEEDVQKALSFIDAKRKGLSQEEFATWQEEMEKIRQKVKARLIVSSATANPKSRRVHLFRELLGFEVGRPSISIRNIVDLYEEPEDLWQRALERIKEFGGGGLIFLPGNEKKERLEEFVEFLQDRGIAASSYEDFSPEEFREGKIQVVIGFASYRNPLARGIDMPDVVRYALFVGVPKMEFTLDISRHTTLYYFLLALLPVIKDNKFLRYIAYLKKLLFIPTERLSEEARKRVEGIYEEITKLLTDEFIQQINESPDISIVKEENFKLITADVTGYIQASGRVSRLYVGGLSLGLSLVLVDSQKAFKSLQKKVRWFSDSIVFQRVDEVDLKNILQNIDADRAKIKAAITGKLYESREFFTTSLVIVESPNKARTIANFYGKPLVRDFGGVRLFEVAKEGTILNIAASKGHLFDLNKEEGFFGVREGFVPLFEPIDDSRAKIVQVLRESGLEVKEVFVATDPDVEGEKIAFDTAMQLRPYNAKIQRAEFHEVTKKAFDEAIKSPRSFDENLVKAQLIRRIADRWIGFSISQYLQKRFDRKSLSAGRVQSAVLEWIVLREYEAREKIFVVRALFDGIFVEFVFANKAEAQNFYNALQSVQISYKDSTSKSLFREPFSTDALLFEASNQLHFSPTKTMQLSQDLFEAGFITYHRTDSTRVSPAGIAIAKEYILDHFGEEFFVPRTHAKAGGAHESIRPTKAMDGKDVEEFVRLSNGSDLRRDHLKLYDLIFRNFIASQMKEATVNEVVAVARALEKETEFSFYSEIIEHGIDLIWPVPLHQISEGDIVVQKQKFARSKTPRYSYAQIIKMMKERGIGRPSTYAITIQKLQDRRYIFERKGLLFATKLGIEVYEELKEHEEMYAFVNEHYTKELESLMDKVEQGKADYAKVIKELYRAIKEKLYAHTL